MNSILRHKLYSDDIIEIWLLKEDIIRVRMKLDGRFKESATERYELIKTDWNEVKATLIENEQSFNITTLKVALDINKNTGEISMSDNNGRVFSKMKPFLTDEEIGVGASFDLKSGERFYGLGFHKNEFLELRSHVLRNHVSYGDCYGPANFLMSSSGWGIFYNTTYDSFYDIGSNAPDIMNIWCEKGELDFYLMIGDFKNLIDLYTQITGRPTIMPIWGYGFMFICHEKETQFDILRDARNFRDEGIPCDMIGLEPGWMQQKYDPTINKDWNQERFFMPFWSEDRAAYRSGSFIGALDRMNFKLSLWMCCDYDVFDEAERKAVIKDMGEQAKGRDGKLEKPFGFGKIDFDTRAHTPKILDNITIKGTPWFDHFKKFIDNGAACFKQDPAWVVNDHPDRLYTNGMTDEDGHNLYTSILAKQVHEGYKEYTGKRPMHYMGTGFTGIQHWAPAWTCDCGGGNEAVMGILNYGICGHMNVTGDLLIHSLEGIHFGFFQAWSQLNSWIEVLHPWYLDTESKQAFKDYANLHYALLPYTYSYAHLGYNTGMPIVRAMPLKYPDDLNAANLTNQYMFGENLLVGVYTDKIYLPEGKWIDFWTKEEYEGSKTIHYVPPKNRGGSLFVKAGAIIPMAPKINSAAELTREEYYLHIYPSGYSEFTLYEDDGESFDFENGEIAKTIITCNQNENEINIKIGNREGYYANMPNKRKWHIIIHNVAQCNVNIIKTDIDETDLALE